jgi:hypothetical protein
MYFYDERLGTACAYITCARGLPSSSHTVIKKRLTGPDSILEAQIAEVTNRLTSLMEHSTENGLGPIGNPTSCVSIYWDMP